MVALSADSVERRRARAAGRVPRASVDPTASVPEACASGSTRAPRPSRAYTPIVYTNGQESAARRWSSASRLNDIDGDPYELYYLFPLTQEEKSLSLVKGTLATAGLFVVVLLGAIAWLVVRQVVTPVRMAAGIAERLSAGRLQERMKVTGEDDIARLGEAFNKMAQNLQLKIQQLEELSRMQRRFVSDVSHELRTPLTTVRMAADVIHEARVDFDPVTARSAELLGDQLDRFESLLADLLEISRFDAGAAALEAEPIDLREVVRRVIGGAEPLAERKGTPDPGGRRPAAGGRRGRRPARGAGAAQPRRQRRGARRGPGRRRAAGCRRAARSRSPCATTASGSSPARRPGSSTASGGPTRHARVPPAVRASGCPSRVEDARLHGGWLQAWGEPGGGSQFRLTLPRTADEPLRGLADTAGARGLAASTADSTTPVCRTPGGDKLATVPVQTAARPDTAADSAAGSAAVAPTADPTALPGNGARVVPRPARRRAAGRDVRHGAGSRAGPGPPGRRAGASGRARGGISWALTASGSGRRAARRLRAVVYAACGAVLLAGCASMPDSGDLRGVESTPRQDAQVRVFAMPPHEDAPPGQIVQGFLEALTSDDPHYETARKYLTARGREGLAARRVHHGAHGGPDCRRRPPGQPGGQPTTTRSR